MNMSNLLPALPEIFLLGMACTILVVDLFLRETQRDVAYFLAQASLLGAAGLTLSGLKQPATLVFGGMFVDDLAADVLKLAIYALTFFVFAYSRAYLRERGMYRGEYFVLGLFGVLGMMIMVSAGHLLTLYLGLELLSLALYAMIAFQRDSVPATEAAMKYFVLGALASGLLLYGLSLFYGLTRSLDIAAVRQALAALPAGDPVAGLALVFVVAAIAFKLGLVPFHMWVPDVYHGSPTAVTLYLGTAPKLAGFALVMRLLVGGLEPLAPAWQDWLAILALLSMAAGNLIAIAQDNLKRMLAYSSISHMGFFLLGVLSANEAGYGAAFFYVLVYATMSLGGFGMIVWFARAGFEADRLEDFKGLNRRSPWHAFLMLLLMFSMAGVPPLAGFYAKLLVIQSVIAAGMIWLAVAAVLFAVIGAYYYLRVVKFMYFDEPADASPAVEDTGRRGGVFGWLLGVNALAMLAVVPWVGDLMALCARAVAAMP
jgi:NADH-quinone oxidoreductase subunit N